MTRMSWSKMVQWSEMGQDIHVIEGSLPRNATTNHMSCLIGMSDYNRWGWTGNKELKVAAEQGSYSYFEPGLTIGQCLQASKRSARAEMERRTAAGEMRKPRASPLAR
jgi:hypothetical protein